MRLLILLIFPVACNAQSFVTLEGQAGGIPNSYKATWGLTVSGGGYLKPTGAFQVGAGVTVNVYYDPFIVPFAQAGYFNPKKKISPYINGRIGYAFLKQALTDVNTNKGGLFLSARAGCGFKVAKLMRVTPFVGVEAYNLRRVVGGETTNSTTAGLYVGGLALIFGR